MKKKSIFNILKIDWAKYFLKVIVSIVLLFIAFNKIDTSIITKNFNQLRISIFVFTFLFGIVQILINTIIQKQYFNLLDERLPLSRTIAINFIGAFYGFLLPSTIGADIYYTHYFTKQFSSLKKAFVGVFSIRLMGLSVSLLLFGLLSLTVKDLLWDTIYRIDYYKITLIIGIGLIVCISLYFIFLKKIKDHVYEVLLLFKTALKNRQGFQLVIVLIILWYIISISGRIFFAFGIGIDQPFLDLAFTILLANLILTLPISISGIGVREISYIAILKLFGIMAEQALLLAFIDFLILLSPVICGGIILLYEAFIKKDLNFVNYKENGKS